MIRRGFVLSEFLSAAAVVALLSVVLVPAVRATVAEPSTEENLRQIGRAAIQYADDHDGRVVRVQQTAFDRENLWPVVLTPYVGSRNVFFDPTRPVPEGETVRVSPRVYAPWFTVVSLSINEHGYSGVLETTGGCVGKRRFPGNADRSLAAMREPERRVAFAPTTWGGTTVGWHSFPADRASWIVPDAENRRFNWSTMVWNTRGLYGGAIPVVHADGSAGRLTRRDFWQGESNTEYCAWMEEGAKWTWGPFWSAE